MDACSLSPEISKADALLLGAFIALLGALATQFIAAFFTAKRERRSNLRIKAEALLTELYAHRGWIENLRDTRLFRGEEFSIPSPLDRAEALQAMYFPAIDGPIAKLAHISASYEFLIAREHTDQLEDKTAWFAKLELGDPLSEVHEDYLTAWDLAISAVVGAARKIA